METKELVGGDIMNTKLVAYRKLMKLNQSQVAEKIGVSLSSYSQKETGKFDFTQTEMERITCMFKEEIPEVTMDDIFFRDGVIKLKT